MSIKYSISKLCKLANVSRSGYYKWINSTEKFSDRAEENKIIKKLILEIHNKYRGTYGRKRMCIAINNKLSFTVNHKRVYRIMKELNIKSVIRKKVYKRKFKPSSVADNILNRDFIADKPLQKLCMDITYIPIDRSARRFLYLNAVKDVFNGQIIAYDLSLRNDVTLVQSTLNKLSKMNLSENCILHTDQGFQYTRRQYSDFLKKIGVIQSTSRKANCWDNAPIESFFSHLKSELLYLVKTTNVDELTKLIHEYIYFYNNERIQIKIGMSPIEYLTHAA